jgi:hypothetical protein
MKHLKSQYLSIITAFAMIAVSLLSFYVLKLPIESNFQLLIYLIFTASIVFNLYNHFKSNAANKSFKDYFSVGFKTFVLIAFLMAIFTYIFFSYNTAFRDDKIAENSRLLLLEGNHLPKEIEVNTQQLKKLFMPIMISSAMFRYLIIGAIVTAITGGYLSTRKTT